jgi:hypothetical protein
MPPILAAVAANRADTDIDTLQALFARQLARFGEAVRDRSRSICRWCCLQQDAARNVGRTADARKLLAQQPATTTVDGQVKTDGNKKESCDGDGKH